MNSYAKASPVVGTAALGVVLLNQLWLLAVAATVVAGAVLLIRFRWRRGRALSDR
jgi:hypothetical protein